MATMKFNQVFSKLVKDEGNTFEAESRKKSHEMTREEYAAWWNSKIMPIYAHDNSAEIGAMFDARCFNIPKEEVVNLIYWRQLDAIRNSIQMCGQAPYSQRQLNGASCAVIKEMMLQDGFDWDAMLPYYQHGTACYYDEHEGWIIDKAMPVLKGVYRDYLERLINVGEE
jgi:tRNA(His) 5'-end guanylyltransferase